jgi:D-beta-D-heptose 7-phosphate kinase/D-beta-D-heptose 1-phosphate adenosyltransferase
VSNTDFQSLVGAFAGRRVLIVGDVMLDEYLWGEVTRVSPEAPVPVVVTRRRTCVPGGAANAARNVASLGGKAILVGLVGEDSQAEALRTALEEAGISTGNLVADSTRPTSTKCRVVAHRQQVVRLDQEDSSQIAGIVEESLLARALELLPSADACVISDYAKGVVTPRIASELIEAARQMGKPVVVDPKGANYQKYQGATIITPNVHEAEVALNRKLASEGNVVAAGQQLCELLCGTAVLITRGAQGMSLFQLDCTPLHIPTVARNVFDVTGAGDTVVATLALQLAAASSLEEATYLANQFAGIVVGKFGTAVVALEDVIGLSATCLVAGAPAIPKLLKAAVVGSDKP